MVATTIRALFNKHGKSATLRTYTDSGNVNNQGQPTFNESTETIDVIVGWEGSHPSVLEKAIGESVFVEEQLFAITEDISLGVATDAVDKKPRIEIGSETWKVERTIESPNPPGITMFQSQRMRS